MTVLQTGSQGRYIAYSPEIDRVISKLESQMHSFHEQKVSGLMSSNPFNLSNSEGITLAQKVISQDIDRDIPDLVSDVFNQVKKDIAASVLMDYLRKVS